MQEQMRKLVEESHNKKSKKNKKKEFSDGSRATPSQTKKKKPSGEVKPVLTDSISASISNVVRCSLLSSLSFQLNDPMLDSEFSSRGISLL